MTRSLMIVIALLTMAGNTPALASGGGGGGSSAPSSSGPSYDPVEEYQKGLQALRDGDYKLAEKAMKKVVRVAKKDANSHYILGLAHYGQEEFKSASRALTKAVRFDETLYDAHAKLAISYLKSDKAEKAAEVEMNLLAALDACDDTCPHRASITQAVAEIAAAKAPAAAPVDVSGLAPAITQASLAQGDLLYSGAVRLINLGHFDDAITELKAAGLVFGPHPDVLTYLGFAHRKKGASDAALVYYSAALKIAPDHLNANEYLGEYYLEQGNYASAQVQLMKLDALCPFGCAQAEELRSWINDDTV